MEFINEVDNAKAVEDVPFERLFETLEFKIRSGLYQILSGEFLRKIQIKQDELSKQGQVLSGRQVLFYIKERFKLAKLRVPYTRSST